MKKGLLLVLILCLFSSTVYAKGEYVSLGLKAACESEGIFFDHSEYHESDEKANIYMFRGQGCEHCYEFLTYLEVMTEKYGDMFNLISYEVWGNSENKRLMERVVRKLRDENSGVPYIVIGNKSWAGYSETLNEEIFAAMEEEFENKNANDVVIKVINEKDTFGFDDFFVICGAIALVGLIFFARSKTKESSQLEESV